MSSVYSSPLRLFRYAIEEFKMIAEVPASEDCLKKEIVFNQEQKVIFRMSKNDSNAFRVDMELILKPEDETIKNSYFMKISGFFSVEEDDEEKKDALITNGAPAILYGLVREIILTMSMKTIYPPVVLQSVFFEPQRSKKAEKKIAKK